MVRLGDLTRSFDAFEPQTAASPASSSAALPPAKAATEPTAATLPINDVSISAEGVRRLQRAAELEAQQAATLKAVDADATLAARMAYEIAHRREVVVVPPAAYTDLATSLYVSGTSPAIGTAGIAKAQSELEQSRLERIALYEQETAKGTPPAEIYRRLLALSAASPAGYGVVIAP